MLSVLPQWHIGHLPTLGAHLLMSYLFAFSYYSWGSRQEYWSGLPFHSTLKHILSELFIMICPSWVALHDMAHSFTESYKLLHHNKAVIHEGCIFNLLLYELISIKS